MQQLSTGLIAISEDTFNGESVLAVNARDLYTFLEVATRFNDWIQRRISEYDLIEGLDFSCTQNRVAENTGLQPRQEYFITIDVAKELSMVERTEKGREVRRYFIEAEKQMKVLSLQAPEPPQLPAPNYATVDAIARKFKITKPLLNFILAQANIGTIKGPFPGKEHYTAHTREMLPWQGNHILWNVDMLKPLIEAEKAPQCVKIPRLQDLEKYPVYRDRISNKEIVKALDITRDCLAYYLVKLKLCVSDSFKRTPLGDSMYELGVGWVHSKLIQFLNEHQPRQLTVI